MTTGKLMQLSKTLKECLLYRKEHKNPSRGDELRNEDVHLETLPAFNCFDPFFGFLGSFIYERAIINVL